ncbi:hypothetical protein K435DRAFT_855890 [Dendrothele bispora CBS 962.96]|uniref:Uncharacterized protein n=1 Tax=Dendrothele bispora (strain CBS 962.96) TaxID=1314807 RepID=A0A4S8M9X9_DENBC|nr:hypothetical protein K435DRAFT_855890 [Dendrothele bispora CBS 962.96]
MSWREVVLWLQSRGRREQGGRDSSCLQYYPAQPELDPTSPVFLPSLYHSIILHLRLTTRIAWAIVKSADLLLFKFQYIPKPLGRPYSLALPSKKEEDILPSPTPLNPFDILTTPLFLPGPILLVSFHLFPFSADIYLYALPKANFDTRLPRILFENAIQSCLSIQRKPPKQKYYERGLECAPALYSGYTKTSTQRYPLNKIIPKPRHCFTNDWSNVAKLPSSNPGNHSFPLTPNIK